MQSEIWQVIYWSPILVRAALVVLLLRHRFVRRVPFFFTYLVVTFGRDLVCFLMYQRGPTVYSQTYWISNLVAAIFIFLASCELSFTRLFPQFHRVRFYRYSFLAAAIVSTAMGLSIAFGGFSLSILAELIHVLDVLQVVGLLFSVGLMIFMGRRWAGYEFGVALGLGVEVTSLVITFAVLLRSGSLHGRIWNLPAVADAVACIIWLIAFWRPGTASAIPAVPVGAGVLQEAKRWEETLKGSLIEKKRF
jgi:hypothetical protein